MALFKKSRHTAIPLEKLSDVEIIASYQESGDAGHVGELYKRYTHLVLGLCLKYLKNEDKAKDAVMEIFEKLLGDLKVHEISNFKSWLYSVAKNHCLMHLRKENRERAVFEDFKNNNMDDFMEIGAGLHPSNKEEKEVQFKMLHEAIGSLKTEQRTCIELFYLKDKTYQEISEITGYELKKVKSYIQNGKRKLEIILKKQDEQ